MLGLSGLYKSMTRENQDRLSSQMSSIDWKLTWQRSYRGGQFSLAYAAQGREHIKSVIWVSALLIRRRFTTPFSCRLVRAALVDVFAVLWT
jgi:hypothetical protein